MIAALAADGRAARRRRWLLYNGNRNKPAAKLSAFTAIARDHNPSVQALPQGVVA